MATASSSCIVGSHVGTTFRFLSFWETVYAYPFAIFFCTTSGSTCPAHESTKQMQHDHTYVSLETKLGDRVRHTRKQKHGDTKFDAPALRLDVCRSVCWLVVCSACWCCSFGCNPRWAILVRYRVRLENLRLHYL
jgi:hypothetical protein